MVMRQRGSGSGARGRTFIPTLSSNIEELGYRHAFFLRFLVKTDAPCIAEAKWVASQEHA